MALLDTVRPHRPPGARPSWKRRALFVVAGYLAIVVGFQVLMFATVLTARLLGHDPRNGDLAEVKNIRRVDDRVLAGAQPTDDGYRDLAAAGVRLVVDLRSGSSDDPREGNQALIRGLGLGYVSLPVPDGHVPDAATVRRLIQLIDETQGLVFLHCGGGVGRSTTMQAAYLAGRGTNPSFADHIAIGPVTLEQAWAIADLGRGDLKGGNVLVRRVSEALDAPRRTLSQLRGWL